MIVKSVTIRKSDGKSVATDMFVDEGYLLEGHAALPDIDLDIAAGGRDSIKDYLRKKYNSDGTQNCFAVGTFGTMKMKAALNAVGKARGIQHSTMNYFTSFIKDDSMDFTGLFKLCLEEKKMKKFVEDNYRVIEEIRPILNQPKSNGVHASAFVITPKHKDGKRVECFDYVPIKLAKDGQLSSEFDGYSVDELGMLKLDLLVTDELMKIREIIKLVNKNYVGRVSKIVSDAGYEGDVLDMDMIHTRMLDDDKTYKMLSDGFTQSVFQFSSHSMTKFLSDLAPDCINDLIVANALYRPGAISIGTHEEYVKYKKGEAEPVYNWGTSEALKSTYGLIVFQENVMRIAQLVGGFSLADAAALMKVVSKKKLDKMKKMKSLFIDGAIKKGCPPEEAEIIWVKIEASSSYLFNLSHAAAYSLTAYDGAWLKCNFPTPFYTIALQTYSGDNIKELMGEIPRNSNCRIIAPDINQSKIGFSANYDTDEIFWSLSRIAFVSAKVAIVVIEDRKEFGDFESFDNFFIRMEARMLIMKQQAKAVDKGFTSPINIRVMRNMILGGCFDRVEKIKSLPERYLIIEKLYNLKNTKIDSELLPADMISKHYFWSVKQIEISGFGSTDYRRIFNESGLKAKKKNTSFVTVSECLQTENEGRKCFLCANILEVEEKSGSTKAGKPYIKGGLKLQQNDNIVEYTFWNESWGKFRSKLLKAKDEVVILSGVIKYNSYSNSNAVTGNSTSVVEII